MWCKQRLTKFHAEACSAGAVELSYEKIDYYEVKVEFMTEDEWKEEEVCILNTHCLELM